MGFFQEIFLSIQACSIPHLIIPCWIPESICTHATGNGWCYPTEFGIISVKTLCFQVLFSPSGVRYGLISSIKFRRIFQFFVCQAGHRNRRLHNNLPCTYSGHRQIVPKPLHHLTSILSITIKCAGLKIRLRYYIRKDSVSVFPPKCIDQVVHIFLKKSIHNT